mgnify:CR=1 FL=1
MAGVGGIKPESGIGQIWYKRLLGPMIRPLIILEQLQYLSPSANKIEQVQTNPHLNQHYQCQVVKQVCGHCGLDAKKVAQIFLFRRKHSSSEDLFPSIADLHMFGHNAIPLLVLH